MEGVWPAYTQPVAFFGYFVFGCLIGEVYLRYHSALKGNPAWILFVLVAFIPLVTVHVESPTQLLKGWTGLLLMSATMLAVTASVFLADPRGHILFFAKWIGQFSYSIYLFHPIVYKGMIVKIFDGTVERIVFTVITTVALSIVVHFQIEKRFRSKQNTAGKLAPPVAAPR